MGRTRAAGWCWLMVVGAAVHFFQEPRCLADEPVPGPVTRSVPRDGPELLQLPYRDDVDGRNLADVRLRICETVTGSHFRAEISPVGPLVSPPPGYRSIQGTNYITAGQLRYLMRTSQGLQARVVIDDQIPIPASIMVNRWRRLPERRLSPTGQIDYLAQSVDVYPEYVVMESGPLDESNPVGEAWFEIWAHGHLRMRFAASHGKQNWFFTGFQSLGEADGPTPPQDATPSAPASNAEVVPLDIDLADWDERDIEGKWVRYCRDVSHHPERRRAWWAFLADRKEYNLLEWIALYEPNRYNDGVGNLLAELGAPQWTRVAAWSFSDQRLHGDHCARREIRKRPEYVIAWGRKYKEALDASVQIEFQIVEDDLAEKGNLPQLADVTDSLPPLTQFDVYGLLDAPLELQEFGDRLRAEPNVVYVHQVIRAIRGFAESGQYNDESLTKLRSLVDHPHQEVRQEALLAYTFLPSWLIPIADFEKRTHDGLQPAPDREAALLALSYGIRPQVDAVLLDVLADRSHPAWKAAVSRLGDLGDAFVLTLLEQSRDDSTSEAETLLLQDAIARIRERWKAIDEAWEKTPKTTFHRYQSALLTAPLERAAWLDLISHPLEHRVGPWTIEQQRKRLKEYAPYREFLEEVQNRYEPDGNLAEALGERREKFQQRVREYAKAVLSEEESP